MAFKSILPPVALLALSACAAASGDYPSLAIRDAERPREAVAIPDSEPPEPAAPLVAGPAMLERIAGLRGQAVVAHRRFLDAAPSARRAVAAGSGAARASDAWAGAQVALADLESRRSQTAIPLADLDTLFTAQAVEFGPVAEIAEARAAVIALVEEEDRVLAGLRARIR